MSGLAGIFFGGDNSDMSHFFIQTGRSRVKEYVDNFRETKFALESNRVKCLRSFNK